MKIKPLFKSILSIIFILSCNVGYTQVNKKNDKNLKSKYTTNPLKKEDIKKPTTTRGAVNVPVSNINFAILKRSAIIRKAGGGVVATITGTNYHLVTISETGKIALKKDNEKGSTFYPAQLAGYHSLQFIGAPSIGFNPFNGNLHITALTKDYRLVYLIENTNGWALHFVADESGNASLRCKANPVITTSYIGILIKNISIVTVSEDGKLVEFNYNGRSNKWVVNYVAELAGRSDELFSVNVTQTQLTYNTQDIVAITNSGKLIHFWNDNDYNKWHGESPAELAGLGATNFKGMPLIIRHETGHSIVAFSSGGKLIAMDFKNRWTHSFPFEGKTELNFIGELSIASNYDPPSSFGRAIIIGLTSEKKLVQVYQDHLNRWTVDYPAARAGNDNLQFIESPVIFQSPGSLKKTIIAKTSDGRYPVIYDNNIWNISYPFE